MFRAATIAILLFGLATPALFSQRRNAIRESAKLDNRNQPKDFTIQTTSRLVLLDVSVKDQKGGFVSGLTKDDFKVYENGKLQEISQFANADIPVTVGIVVDESGSMGPKRPEVITAALAFITASNPKDEVFVINFNEHVNRGLPEGVLFSDNIQQLREALRRDPPVGRTALYDAVLTALQQLDRGSQDKKTLVLISDGGDNASNHRLKEAMDAVLKSAATIYTIGIFDADDPDRNPTVLKNLARVSGGDVFFPRTLEGMIPACRQIAKDIRTRYTIGYVPAEQNGKRLRSIRVVAASPDRERLIARTRTSYLFPESPASETQ
jgi:VWFA-related protein